MQIYLKSTIDLMATQGLMQEIEEIAAKSIVKEINGIMYIVVIKEEDEEN